MPVNVVQTRAADVSREILRGLFGDQPTGLVVRLWDGTLWPAAPSRQADAVLVLTQPMIVRGWAKEITDYAELMSLPAGTKVPGVIGRPFSGHRADITAGHTWINGTYTLEIARKFNTGDPEHDVIFDDLTKPYYFGVAVFDNTQIGHAASDAFPMVFQKR